MQGRLGTAGTATYMQGRLGTAGTARGNSTHTERVSDGSKRYTHKGSFTYYVSLKIAKIA